LTAQQLVFLFESVAAVFFHVSEDDSAYFVTAHEMPVKPPHFNGSGSQQVEPAEQLETKNVGQVVALTPVFIL